MKQSKAISVTKRDIRKERLLYKEFTKDLVNDKLAHDINFANKEVKTVNEVKEKEKKEIGCQFKKRCGDLTCNCVSSATLDNREYKQKHIENNNQIGTLDRPENNSDIKVGRVRTITKRKVKKVYLNSDDHGVGSFDLSAYLPLSGKDKNNVSKCVGTGLDCVPTNVISEKVPPQTVSGATSPILNLESKTNIVQKNPDDKEAKNVDEYKILNNDISKSKSSHSNITSIHEFEDEINLPAGDAEQDKKIESDILLLHDAQVSDGLKDVKKHEKSNNKLELRTTSTFKRTLEALKKGFKKKEGRLSDLSNSIFNTSLIELSSIDVIVPPKLNANSKSSEHNKLSELDMKVKCIDNIKQNSYELDSSLSEIYDSNSKVEGMFKVWGKKFDLENEIKRDNDSMYDYDMNENEAEMKQDDEIAKPQKRSFFKRRKKMKFKFNRTIVTGCCQVKRGVMIKVSPIRPLCNAGGKHSERVKQVVKNNKHVVKNNSIVEKKIKPNVSERSLHVQWNNDFYRSDSTIDFETIFNNINYSEDAMSKSKSECTESFSSYYSNIPQQSVNVIYQNVQAWMIHEITIDRNLKPIQINDNKLAQYSKRDNNIELKSSNKWPIDKSKAFSRQTEAFLQSNNLIKHAWRENSEKDYLKVNIRRSFLVDSDSNWSLKKRSSEEKVYNIINYETMTKNKCEGITSTDKCSLNIGDTGLNDNKVTNSFNERNNAKSRFIETLLKTPSIVHNDVIAQKNHGHIHKKCDIIGVGIFTQKDSETTNKPILKHYNNDWNVESEVSLHKVETKYKFADAYLRDDYRHWMSLGLVYSWCNSDSHLHSSETENNKSNQEDCRSCPNIYDNYNASAEITRSSICAISSCSQCIIKEISSKDQSTTSRFLKKIKMWAIFKNNESAKRVLPKDSLEVFKKRKYYSTSKAACYEMNDVPELKECEDQLYKQRVIDRSNGKKRVLVVDAKENKEDTNRLKNLYQKIQKLSGILNYGSSYGKAKPTNTNNSGDQLDKKKSPCIIYKKKTSDDKFARRSPCKKPAVPCKIEQPQQCNADQSLLEKMGCPWPLNSTVSKEPSKCSQMDNQRKQCCSPSLPKSPNKEMKKCCSKVRSTNNDNEQCDVKISKLLASSNCSSKCPAKTSSNKMNNTQLKSPPRSPPKSSGDEKELKSSRTNDYKMKNVEPKLSPIHKCPGLKIKVEPSSSNESRMKKLSPKSPPKSPKIKKNINSSGECKLQKTSSKSPPKSPLKSPSKGKKVINCSSDESKVKKSQSPHGSPFNLPGLNLKNCSSNDLRNKKGNQKSKSPSPSSPERPFRFPGLKIKNSSSNNVKKKKEGQMSKSPSPPRNKTPQKSPLQSPKKKHKQNSEYSSGDSCPSNECDENCKNRELLKNNSVKGKDSNPELSRPKFIDKIMDKIKSKTNNMNVCSNEKSSKEKIVCNAELLENYSSIKLNSTENITIRLKKDTPSTEEIRELQDIHVCENASTNFSNYNHKQQEPSILGDLYESNVNVNVVHSQTKVQKDCSNSKDTTPQCDSETNASNIVEIHFKLRLTQGDKTTEINLASDNDKSDQKRCNNEIGPSPQDIYLLKNNCGGSVDSRKGNKKDLNIKIIIQNYKNDNKSSKKDDKTLQIVESKREHVLNINDFSRKISKKFNTVSTGYSDTLISLSTEKNNESIDLTHRTDFSIHKATIDLTSSTEKANKLSYKTSSDISTEPCIRTSFSSKSTRDVPSTPSVTEKSLDYSLNKQVDKEISKNINKDQILELDDTITSATSLELQTNSETSNNITGEDCIVTDISNHEQARPLTKREKKDALKNIFEKANDMKHNKTNVRKLRSMLKSVLTSSDSGASGLIAVASNELIKEINDSVYPDRSKISVSSDKVTDNVKLKYYPSIQENSVCFSSNTDDSDMDNVEEKCDMKKECLCGKFAERLNAAKIFTGANPACCCRPRKTFDNAEINCDLRSELDYSMFNMKTSFKDVQTDNSIREFKNFDDKGDLSFDNIKDNVDAQDIVMIKSVLNKITNKKESKYESNEDNKLQRNNISRLNSEQKIVFLARKATNVSMEARFLEEMTKLEGKLKNNFDINNTIVPAEILQSYETKKAVLKLYAENTHSDEHVVAKLPKFVGNGENIAVNNKLRRQSEVASSHKSYSSKYSKRNIVMMSVKR